MRETTIRFILIFPNYEKDKLFVFVLEIPDSAINYLRRLKFLIPILEA
ncbi:hypothetical protein Vi05172_g7057 [Venturia inaequalis]|nr:hypothetical protein Vi05172_g7057 [Venturia inaequalis]